ncbi:lipocalin family protein [Tamlana crocina]
MKKTNLISGLLIILMILFSCSNNENSDSTPKDASIIGVWKPTKVVTVCSTIDEVDELSICEQNGRITFNDNGTLSTNDYGNEYINGASGDCVESSNGSGTWILKENKLDLFIKYANTGEEENDNLNATVYKLTDTTLQIGYLSDDPNDCNDGIKPTYYYTEYIRVE